MKSCFLSIILWWSAAACSQTPRQYITFQADTLNLFTWEGSKMVIQSLSDTLDPGTMGRWLATMDSAYNFYAKCNGREPYKFSSTFINNLSAISEVNATCGAGCGYLGTTGIEILSSYFQTNYNAVHNQNRYDQIPFYELGRNFWFYDPQLKYKTNDPVVTGYAVFMRFMAMEAANIQGADFNAWTFNQFRNNVKGLLTTYMADTTLTWHTTLGANTGIPNSGLGATDLFASFCFDLKEKNCGNDWVENVWKYAAQRPAAATTQDAVDNFIIVSSQAANKNLSYVFQTWKWPISVSALIFLDSLNLGMISEQPLDINVSTNSFGKFSVSSSSANATFQWQQTFDSAFHDITDGGIFNGSSSNTLTINLPTQANNNQRFRCIVSGGSCYDTSHIGTLTVLSITNIQTTQSKHYLDFDIDVDLHNKVLQIGFMENSTANKLQIISLQGQLLYTGAMLNGSNVIDISQLSSGTYIALIESNGNHFQTKFMTSNIK